MHEHRQRIAVHSFWIAVSVSICWGAVQLDLGLLTEPGPGFMPLIMGTLLLLLAIAAIFERIPEERRPPPSRERLSRVGLTVVALLAYAVLLPLLGFIPVTLLFMFFLFRAIQGIRWPVALIASALSVGLCYLLFSSLGAEFPKGLFS